MKPSAAFTLVLALLGTATVALAGPDEAGKACISCAVPCRTTTFHYCVTVEGVPEGARQVRLWLPVPQDSECQKIADFRVSTGGRSESVTEERFQNRAMRIAFDGDSLKSPTAELSFTVHRQEVRPDLKALEGKADSEDGHAGLEEFLRGDRLVVVDDAMRALAARVTQGKVGTIAKAHAIYDYVFDTMTYSKEGEGWGKGSTAWALEKKYGNCTDFHALFIALCRGAGIPARFDMGVPLPTQAPSGTVGGYHCWAFFHVPQVGWVPVDISEADKHPEKKDYFFGAIDADRITFTTGRDLRIGQHGDPLNFFIYPYAEVDGKAHAGVKREFRYEDRAGKKS